MNEDRSKGRPWRQRFEEEYKALVDAPWEPLAPARNGVLKRVYARLHARWHRPRNAVFLVRVEAPLSRLQYRLEVWQTDFLGRIVAVYGEVKGAPWGYPGVESIYVVVRDAVNEARERKANGRF